MKLSISTLGCPGWSLEQAAAFLHDCGVEGIEIRGIGGELEPTKMACLAQGHLSATHAVLKKYKLTPVCLGTSVAMHRDGDNVTRALEDAKVCAAAGIPAIRIFGNNLPSDSAERSIKLRSISNDIARLCREAEPLGIGVWLETHGDINTPQTLSKIIEACGDLPNFGLIWDVAHTFASHCRNIELILNEIYPYVRHVHFKDQVVTPGEKVRICLPGRGEIPLVNILEALSERGYTGYYSFEWEKLWHPEIEAPEVAFPYFVNYINRLYEKIRNGGRM